MSPALQIYNKRKKLTGLLCLLSFTICLVSSFSLLLREVVVVVSRGRHRGLRLRGRESEHVIRLDLPRRPFPTAVLAGRGQVSERPSFENTACGLYSSFLSSSTPTTAAASIRTLWRTARTWQALTSGRTSRCGLLSDPVHPHWPRLTSRPRFFPRL